MGQPWTLFLSGSRLPHLVKPNRQEFNEHPAWLEVEHCHLSDGAAGVRLKTGERYYRITSEPIVEINPIGSGDCYLSLVLLTDMIKVGT